jgi:hypothetical protein
MHLGQFLTKSHVVVCHNRTYFWNLATRPPRKLSPGYGVGWWQFRTLGCPKGDIPENTLVVQRSSNQPTAAA